MLSRFNHQSNKVQHYSVCACVLPLCAVDGAAVTTVEGIGSMATELHPCQVGIYYECRIPTVKSPTPWPTIAAPFRNELPRLMAPNAASVLPAL